MKTLLVAAFALSLILVVSAQCDLNAADTCYQDVLQIVSLAAWPASYYMYHTVSD